MGPLVTVTSSSVSELPRLHAAPASVQEIRASGPSTGAPSNPFGDFDATKSYREVRAAFEAAFERAYVSWLLSRHDGNISAAAREAKMDRKYLYDLAREHGLRNPRA